MVCLGRKKIKNQKLKIKIEERPLADIFCLCAIKKAQVSLSLLKQNPFVINIELLGYETNISLQRNQNLM
jgi:hypothetical protein